MPLSFDTAATVRRFQKTLSLGPGAQRQPYNEGAKADQEFSRAVDSFFPSLDETPQDGAQGQPGLLRFHTSEGQRLNVEFMGNSKEGRYLQEWVGGGYIFAEFSENTVDSLGVTPQGVHHIHVDRAHPENSYVETAENPWVIFGAEPAAQAPPKYDPDKLITTESGLGYAVLKEGDGPVAKTGQQVMVHYSGWLEDGTKFDSSRDRKQPFSFSIGRGVIKGWSEGVAGMKVGEKRLLKIPPELAYGDTPPGGIPKGATLLFEVDLLATPEG